MPSPLLAGMSALWVQPDGAGNQPFYLGCHSLGDIAQQQGAKTLLFCPDESGNNAFKVIGSYKAAKGPATALLTTNIFATADWLEQVKDGIPIYLVKALNGRRDIFGNYDRIYILTSCTITNKTLVAMSALQPADNRNSQQTFELSADDLYRIWSITAVRQGTTEPDNLTDIVFFDLHPGRMALNGYAANIATAGSATNEANVLHTTDGGVTWTAVSGNPFGGGLDIGAIEAFAVDATTIRILAAKGTTQAGETAQVSYSDDQGVTWTVVDVGSTNGQFVEGPSGLFALDLYHIWLVTQDGYSYFSSDGGVTWTNQTAAAPLTDDLLSISALDASYAVVGGKSNALMKTQNGGTTWAEVTGPSAESANDANAVVQLDADIMLAGYSDGKLYRTEDGGVTWDEKSFSGSGTGSIVALEFNNPYVGFMVRNIAGVGSVLRTWDGGHTWEVVTTPVNSGLNSLHVVADNEAFVVGDTHTSTGFIAKAS